MGRKTAYPELMGQLKQKNTAVDWSDCPIVKRNPKKMDGVPTVREWRVSADSIVENYEGGSPAEEIAENFGLPMEDVRAILAYAQQARHIAHPVR